MRSHALPGLPAAAPGEHTCCAKPGLAHVAVPEFGAELQRAASLLGTHSTAAALPKQSQENAGWVALQPHHGSAGASPSQHQGRQNSKEPVDRISEKVITAAPVVAPPPSVAPPPTLDATPLPRPATGNTAPPHPKPPPKVTAPHHPHFPKETPQAPVTAAPFQLPLPVLPLPPPAWITAVVQHAQQLVRSANTLLHPNAITPVLHARAHTLQEAAKDRPQVTATAAIPNTPAAQAAPPQPQQVQPRPAAPQVDAPATPAHTAQHLSAPEHSSVHVRPHLAAIHVEAPGLGGLDVRLRMMGTNLTLNVSGVAGEALRAQTQELTAALAAQGITLHAIHLAADAETADLGVAQTVSHLSPGDSARSLRKTLGEKRTATGRASR